MHGGKADEEQVMRNVESLKGKLDGFERILSKHKYLAGDVRHKLCASCIGLLASSRTALLHRCVYRK